MSAALVVVRAGLLTTIQDLGRWGHQSSGVPVSGAMDSYSLRLANALVGNPDGAAALEITLLGPVLRAESAVTVAMAGATFALTVDGVAMPHGAAFEIPAGAELRVGPRLRGARAYLAVAGGVATPAVLGSRSTHLVSRMGGLEGRALVAGDRVPVAGAAVRVTTRRTHHPLPLPGPLGAGWLRVLLGPQDDRFTPAALEALLGAPFAVSATSDRMGFRLEGPLLATRRPAELVSEAVAFGALQVPPSGAPILLMADRQTAGGYPKIATVITADLPLSAQLAPGDAVRFTACTRGEARSALLTRERQLLRAVPDGGRA